MIGSAGFPGGKVLERNGLAIPLALGAVLIVGAVVVSGFFSTNMRGRIGNAALLHGHAVASAAQAEARALALVDVTALQGMAVGETSAATTHTLANGERAVTMFARVQDNIYLLSVSATAGDPASRSQATATLVLFRLVSSTTPADSTAELRASPVVQRAWSQQY
jgi:hypothetical protein